MEELIQKFGKDIILFGLGLVAGFLISVLFPKVLIIIFFWLFVILIMYIFFKYNIIPRNQL